MTYKGQGIPQLMAKHNDNKKNTSEAPLLITSKDHYSHASKVFKEYWKEPVKENQSIYALLQILDFKSQIGLLK